MARSTTASTIALAVANAAATAVVAVSAPAQAADTPVDATTASISPAMDAEVYEQRVLASINAKRRDRGRKPLRLEPCTDAAAERWGSFLALNDEFFHQPLGILIEGCGATYAGETLAMGAVSPRRIVRLWMRSPGHRHILLSRSPRRIGVSAYPSDGQWVVTADYTRF